VTRAQGGDDERAGATTRYVMIGGFLGAGKTTAMLRFAEWLAGRGLRAGLVTNDQGGGLVDTALAGVRGLPVEEITGGCFCCRFNSLVEAADALRRGSAPEVLVAEPVGSCTDLVATVSLPLESLHGDRFTLAPASVVVDPLRAERVLGMNGGRLSDHVHYIYRKQLEEAEIVVVNKIDLLADAGGAARLERLREALAEAAPHADVLACSARTGVGLEAWFERMLHDASRAAAIADIDYDRYALAESLLGWLNAEARLVATDGGEFDGNAVLLDLLGRVRGAIDAAGHEIAHLKATLAVEGDPYELAAANLVRTDDAPVLSHRLAESLDVGRLLVNLRAEADPALLDRVVRGALAEMVGVGCEVVHLEHFRPGRPVPSHRIASQS
jgi:G3E family GTPase